MLSVNFRKELERKNIPNQVIDNLYTGNYTSVTSHEELIEINGSTIVKYKYKALQDRKHNQRCYVITDNFIQEIELSKIQWIIKSNKNLYKLANKAIMNCPVSINVTLISNEFTKEMNRKYTNNDKAAKKIEQTHTYIVSLVGNSIAEKLNNAREQLITMVKKEDFYKITTLSADIKIEPMLFDNIEFDVATALTFREGMCPLGIYKKLPTDIDNCENYKFIYKN